LTALLSSGRSYDNNNDNDNNNNPICKAPKALALEALAAGQSWVLRKSLMKEVCLKPRFKDKVSQH